MLSIFHSISFMHLFRLISSALKCGFGRFVGSAAYFFFIDHHTLIIRRACERSVCENILYKLFRKYNRKTSSRQANKQCEQLKMTQFCISTVEHQLRAHAVRMLHVKPPPDSHFDFVCLLIRSHRYEKKNVYELDKSQGWTMEQTNKNNIHITYVYRISSQN